MTKRMLIDSTQAEETRVVVLDGNRLEDFDVETSTKQQLKGNIYLAKVVRVEPSLQAAFVEYGGGRHGFLAFGEIHPDYYQIPVADRQRLLEMQEAEAREDEDAEDRAAARDARDAQVTRSDATLVAVPDATLVAVPEVAADMVEMADQAGAPDVMDAITEASYAIQADPEAAEAALPHPDQVAQAAAISQDILIAPNEAATLFPDAVPSHDAADAEVPGAESPAALGGESAETPSLEPAAAPVDAAAETPSADQLEEPGADMAPESANLDAEVPDVSAQEALKPDAPGSELTAFDGPEIDGAATEPAAANGMLDEAAADHPTQNGFPAANSFEDAEPPPESLGGEVEEPREQRAPPRFSRNYKIQEVIRRRQILLIQVVKEERGTKGAALTTYISLAGRFSVLMPNSPRGGGISRKITSAADRRRLKEVTAELDLPRGMGLIVRTAGANRPKPEIIRDCEYLLNQWDQIRDLTMKSVAPALIYEEANLIKRAIRDVYSRDVDDILVDGEQGWRAARDFMRMLMPTHARKVQLWKDPQPLFVKAQVEAQLDAMLSPTVQLRSGGYLVINQTEALVAIDVNSGRSTRERGIEETALKTNMEAAEEAARQLRLRDLAGLIVIDFIDMESRRNIASVEKRLKDALKIDRARIQIGSISAFGLMEMSRQRLRPSLAETSLVMCTHCGGTGHVRSTESAALHVLRAVEEEGAKRRAAEIVVHVAGSIALYVLNHKRVRLAEIENRYAMRVAFAADDALLPPNTRIDRVRAQAASELPAPISQLAPPEPFEDPDEEAMEQAGEQPEEQPGEQAADQSEELPVDALADASDSDDDTPRPGETAEEEEQRSRRRRRRRRGGRREDSVAENATSVTEAGQEATESAMLEAEAAPAADGEGAMGAGDAVMAALRAEPTQDDAPAAVLEDGASAATADVGAAEVTAEGAASETSEAAGDDADRSKRRGRRGGRRRRREPGDIAAEPADAPPSEANDAPAYSPPAYVPPAYVGPTPADPFGGSSAFDIFDAIEQAEQERALAAIAPRARTPEPETAEPPVVEMQAAPTVQDMPPEPEPVIAEPVALEPETVSLADPEPIVEAVVHSAENNPVETLVESGVEPAPEPVAGPLVVPTLINGADTLTEKKRGWWQR